ncbi:hypothetical protein Tco_0845075 [Tanacetum coccineum]
MQVHRARHSSADLCKQLRCMKESETVGELSRQPYGTQLSILGLQHQFAFSQWQHNNALEVPFDKALEVRKEPLNIKKFFKKTEEKGNTNDTKKIQLQPNLKVTPKNPWEKYDVKGWCEKKAHKYGRLNEKSWWEKADKWAETELRTKWEEKFFWFTSRRDMACDS